MRNTQILYSCDKCGRKLKTDENSVDIVTSLSESAYWSRLHVRIINRHGRHNDAEENKAELCKPCTIKVLKDALERIRLGERATAGVESSSQKDWES